MSRVYFHTPTGGAELLGSERAYAGNLCSRLLWAALNPSSFHADDWQRLLPAGSYVKPLRRDEPGDGLRWQRDLQLWLSSFDERAGLRLPDGTAVNLFDLALNTVVAMRSPVLTLLAHLHGQCEIHGWVDGPDRAWLAEIIRAGLDEKVLRADMGWDDVVALLEAGDDAPVVTSYSVCERFPNAIAADWTPPAHAGGGEDGEPNWDAWYDLPTEKQWELGMHELRREEQGLQWSPARWGRGFGDNITGWDVAAVIARTAIR